jgi:hypothetical protein
MYVFWTNLPLNVNRIFQFGQVDSIQGVGIWDQKSQKTSGNQFDEKSCHHKSQGTKHVIYSTLE